MGSLVVVIVSLFCLLLDLGASVHDEGRALLRFKQEVEIDPYGALLGWNEEEIMNSCFWFGIQCQRGKVVALKLKNLGLRGKLSLELGKLIHLKVLNLHNNSFSGPIPEELAKLHNLEVLNLGHNNLSGPLPDGLDRILSLRTLIIRNNGIISHMSQRLQELNLLSELQVEADQLSSQRKIFVRTEINSSIRRLLQVDSQEKAKEQNSGRFPAGHFGSLAPAELKKKPKRSSQHVTTIFISPSPGPFPSPKTTSKSHANVPTPPPVLSPSLAPSSIDFPKSPLSHIPTPIPAPATKTERPSGMSSHQAGSDTKIPSISDLSLPPDGSPAPSVISKNKHTRWAVYAAIAGSVSFLIAILLAYIVCWRANKVVTIKPWATGLSGQLQKAFVTGVPALKRSELQAACEDFSNIIGSLSDSTMYKGTLSSGVEIAVISRVVKSAKGWSKTSESQFRKKVTMLSKVNHKNFLNLLGFCEEVEPFTRMMVFEYAPNGTLFEHLHIKESEHLDWLTRMRIVMGLAYCLEHMLQLQPPVIPKNLDSSSVYLTEDYAAKLSDFEFWSEATEFHSSSGSSGSLELLPDKESVISKFGTLLLEIISGRGPLPEDGSLEEWAACYLNGEKPLKDMIDPSLQSYNPEVLEALIKVIRSCISSESKERPTMTQVASQLRDITSMSPDGATPKVSPLWWAELEILSTEAN